METPKELTLKEKLKDSALNMAEDHARLAIEQVKKIGKILVEHTENPFDDVAYQGVLMLEAEFLKLVDKIDGQVG